MPTINRPKKKQNYKKHGRSEQAYNLYNTSKWKKLRLAHLMLHPICEECNEAFSVEVHHIKPILTGETELDMQELAYNPSNLKALCVACHHKIHNDLRK